MIVEILPQEELARDEHTDRGGDCNHRYDHQLQHLEMVVKSLPFGQQFGQIFGEQTDLSQYEQHHCQFRARVAAVYAGEEHHQQPQFRSYGEVEDQVERGPRDQHEKHLVEHNVATKQLNLWQGTCAYMIQKMFI
jgi:hypothetical protein